MTGVACVMIEHDCLAPSFVSLDLDTTNLLTYDEEELEDPGDRVPLASCFDTSAFADDEYTLEVTSTCPSGTTYDSLTIEIDNPAFRLGRYGTGVCNTPPLAFYGAEGYIDVCGTGNGKSHQSEWAMTHEFFHWFGYQFQIDEKGNGAAGLGYPEAAAFGEGFATMMTHLVTGYAWVLNKGECTG